MYAHMRHEYGKTCADPSIIQSLWKSGSMYKLRLSGFNYREVQGDTRHASQNVLMEHYNEVATGERQALAMKIQEDFYAPAASTTTPISTNWRGADCRSNQK